LTSYELGGHLKGTDGLRRERSRITLELSPVRLQFAKLPNEPLLVDGPGRTAKDYQPGDRSIHRT
jgi:hypothetical protein